MKDLRKRTDGEFATSIDFPTLVNALTRPDAFPCVLPEGEPIRILQTHASVVLLTPDTVYKLKKPKNFGFFDYSAPALRRHFCRQEVLVNTPLAPQVYLGVAPVLAFSDGRVCFGPTFPVHGHPPDGLPVPGTLLNGGEVVDYAVVMVRLPDEATLESRVRAGSATPSVMREIAHAVAAFHAGTPTNEHVASFGSLETIRGNWEENFAQMKPFVGRTLDLATYETIVGYVRHFLEARRALLSNRVRAGRIRDCHGDLRLQHIYVLEGEHAAAHHLPRLVILDRIEFNERFRYGDVAAEIAFLTMELDAASRPDLSRVLVDSYVTETGDEALREVVPFYACYRACVRGKVISFQLDESEVPEVQREMACQGAAALFAQAASYARGPTKSLLIMIGGLMGTGKSTVARMLQHELGGILFSSDIVRKRLAHRDPTQPQADAFGQGVYSAEWTARTYHALRAETSAALEDGHSVVLDASFLRRADRQAVAQEARARGAQVLFVECICPRAVVLQRLARRWKARMEGKQLPGKEASLASDGRPDLYDAQCKDWEPFNADEEPQVKHVLVTTTLPIAVTLEQVLDTLHIPRLACWLA